MWIRCWRLPATSMRSHCKSPRTRRRAQMCRKRILTAAGRAAAGVKVMARTRQDAQTSQKPKKKFLRDLRSRLTDVYYSRLNVLPSFQCSSVALLQEIPHGKLEQGDVDRPVDA